MGIGQQFLCFSMKFQTNCCKISNNKEKMVEKEISGKPNTNKENGIRLAKSIERFGF